jgi:hypothetical protein
MMTGATGAGVAVFASSGQITLATGPGGVSQTPGCLPLSGFTPAGVTTALPARQIVPVNETFTGMQFQVVTNAATSLVGSTVSVAASRVPSASP